MSGLRIKYDENYKKNAVALSYASEKTVKEVSDELGINDGLLYMLVVKNFVFNYSHKQPGWWGKYTPDGDKMKCATLEEKNKELRLELAETKMECDILAKYNIKQSFSRVV